MRAFTHQCLAHKAEWFMIQNFRPSTVAEREGEYYAISFYFVQKITFYFKVKFRRFKL